jgi:hypothetical protein
MMTGLRLILPSLQVAVGLKCRFGTSPISMTMITVCPSF